jgi:glycosyltransferase involved in cell wall biosynthesis
LINLGILTSRHFPHLGGMEFAIHNLSNSLAKKPHMNVFVACATNRNIPPNFEYAYNCNHAKSFSYLTSYLFKHNQKKMIRNNKINILYGPMLHEGGYWAASLGKKFNIPSIVNSRGSDFQYVEKIAYGALLDIDLKKKIKKTLENSTHIVALSKYNAKCLVRLGARPDKISVIHNGILIDEINAIPTKNLRHLWGVGPEDFIITTVGRNAPIKRMNLLFNALKILKEYKEIKCVCIGPKKDLIKTIKEKKLNSKILLLGELPKNKEVLLEPPYSEIINSYRSSDLFISCSYYEAFSNATTDALACGIPVIIGTNHGVGDIIVPSKTGYIMKDESPEELAELIYHCYKSREQLKNSEKEIKKSVSELTWDRISSEYHDLISDII